MILIQNLFTRVILRSKFVYVFCTKRLLLNIFCARKPLVTVLCTKRPLVIVFCTKRTLKWASSVPKKSLVIVFCAKWPLVVAFCTKKISSNHFLYKNVSYDDMLYQKSLLWPVCIQTWLYRKCNNRFARTDAT